MFTGSPDFEDKRKESVPEEPVRYVGKPTDEIDAAWDKLTEGEFSSQIFFPVYLHRSCASLKSKY